MRTVKADLHNHLRTTSYFREGDFNRAVDIGQKRLGEGGIFGVVNFSDTRYEKFSELKGYERVFVGEEENGVYVPERDILIVKGQEVPTRSGHLLVMGLPKNKHIKERRTLVDTISEARDKRGIVIADHPFYRDGIGHTLLASPELIEGIDAIESFNGEAALWIPKLTPGRANRKAEKFSDYVRGYTFSRAMKRLGRLTSSDGHSFLELGRCWTALEVSDDHNEFNNTNFRAAVRSAPHFKGVPVTYTCSVTSQETPLRIPALMHAVILYSWIAGTKIPQGVRRAIGIEKYYDVPRPESLEEQ